MSVTFINTAAGQPGQLTPDARAALGLAEVVVASSASGSVPPSVAAVLDAPGVIAGGSRGVVLTGPAAADAASVCALAHSGTAVVSLINGSVFDDPSGAMQAAAVVDAGIPTEVLDGAEGSPLVLDASYRAGRPLFGHVVVVTRPEAQADELAAPLRAIGAVVVTIPAIAIGPPADDGAALDAAVGRLRNGEYQWLVVTSPNGARAVAERLGSRGVAHTRVAAIGPGTAEVLEAAGIATDLVPPAFVAESLLEAFPDPPVSGDGAPRVLLARAAVARDVLPVGLRDRGWDVDVVEAYRTSPARLGGPERTAVSNADVVTFTSSSTVEAFCAGVGVDAVPPVVACIGPVTADTARTVGLEVAVEAVVHTTSGLVDALVAHFTR